MKIPAVTIDITDDGTAYTVTALPWPTVESSGHLYTARLVHTTSLVYGDGYRTEWTPDKMAAFVEKLLATYPQVSA